MKTKLIIFIAMSAIVTLSFSFISVKDATKAATPAAKAVDSAPIGGLAIEEGL